MTLNKCSWEREGCNMRTLNKQRRVWGRTLSSFLHPLFTRCREIRLDETWKKIYFLQKMDKCENVYSKQSLKTKIAMLCKKGKVKRFSETDSLLEKAKRNYWVVSLWLFLDIMKISKDSNHWDRLGLTSGWDPPVHLYIN